MIFALPINCLQGLQFINLVSDFSLLSYEPMRTKIHHVPIFNLLSCVTCILSNFACMSLPFMSTSVFQIATIANKLPHNRDRDCAYVDFQMVCMCVC